MEIILREFEWDWCFKPGVVEELFCPTCGKRLRVKRNTWHKPSIHVGFTSHFDVFWCSNRSKNWHGRIPRLREEIEQTSSLKLRKILQSELDEILIRNGLIQKRR